MMIAGSPHPVTGRPGRVRAAAIRRVTLAGAAVILVGAALRLCLATPSRRRRAHQALRLG